MEETITFHIDREDKQSLIKIAKQNRLTLSTFCRYSLLKLIKDEVGDGNSEE